jgi:hypothetical protein
MVELVGDLITELDALTEISAEARGSGIDPDNRA